MAMWSNDWAKHGPSYSAGLYESVKTVVLSSLDNREVGRETPFSNERATGRSGVLVVLIGLPKSEIFSKSPSSP